MGLSFRFLIPKEFSLLNKAFFAFLSGLFLVVLIPQNLVYFGVPVRISAWLLLAGALTHLWCCRRQIGAWIGAPWADADLRTLVVVVLLSITFHGVVPIKQGLEWYYGKGYFDQINYVLLAEFLKKEPYGTNEQDIGLRPWLIKPVGFNDQVKQLGKDAWPAQKANGIKKERIGQSIVTAEISVWSGLNAKAGYAATVIFFLTALAICLYVFLRETGVDCLMAGAGALLAASLPAITRLSLDGFLSQVSILFVFPFFASLLRRQELNARSFTFFFSLTLAYVVAAYSEIAVTGFATFFLGVMIVRRDQFRTKRLMLMSSLLLVALMNLFYLPNLIGFLAQQFYYASQATWLENMAPKLLTLRGWSELIFGAVTYEPLAWFFDGCALFIGVLILVGLIALSRRDRLVFGAILLPPILIISYLSYLLTRDQPAYYSIAKLILTILPFLIVLVFVPLSIMAAHRQGLSLYLLRYLLCPLIVAAAAAGSVRYYAEVLNNGSLLRYVRDPHFLKVCQELEKIRNKRVMVFETHPLLTPWLCFHARHNEVYFNARSFSDSPVPQVAAFLTIPDLKDLDFVATRDRLIDLRAPGVSCLTLIDDSRGEDRREGPVRYWLGPPTGLRFLALQAISANLTMRLVPGPEAKTLPVNFFLADDQGHISEGEISGKGFDVRRLNFPRGLSNFELSVKEKAGDPTSDRPFPILAELDGIELSDINRPQ